MHWFPGPLLGSLLAAALAAAAPGAAAQGFPDRPVRLIVPFPPGGLVDSLARVVADGMRGELGQPVVVDNRAGAAGKIGAQAVAAAAPDGYTLLLSNGTTHGTLPVVDPSFEAVRDFASVSLVTVTPFVLAAHPDLRANTVAELLRLAAAQPGKLNYATPGSGTAAHFAGELLKSLGGVDIVHVPYKGLAPALTDVLGGRVELIFDSTILQHLRAGKLKALATTGIERSPLLPDVPTLHESGLKGYDIVGWAGLSLPAKAPAEAVARLNAAAVKALAQPALAQRLREMGLVPVSSTPQHMARLIDDSIARYRRIAADNKLRFD
ncbi:MAG: tripartite tricarboxylate transporter substrate binding protein [Burkholderiales bacterium]|nr:tripartite tricarboxylate transporter substrate binding protein [Burkholderiales bacterium]